MDVDFQRFATRTSWTFGRPHAETTTMYTDDIGEFRITCPRDILFRRRSRGSTSSQPLSKISISNNNTISIIYSWANIQKIIIRWFYSNDIYLLKKRNSAYYAGQNSFFSFTRTRISSPQEIIIVTFRGTTMTVLWWPALNGIWGIFNTSLNHRRIG